MNRSTTGLAPGRRLTSGLLALILCVLPAAARPDDPDELKKEIAAVEQQIAELTKKLEELRSRGRSVSARPAGLLDSAIAKMTWRCIGPANMGGRITALAVVESDPSTYYVATASGGLLKTTNNGVTFTHLFDREATVSIGDVAVAPSDPNVVWVGTGENNPRNSVSYGDGVYKSSDGGKTWTNMGLKRSFQIGKIVIHPKNADVVYVGALGRLYGPNEERGLFKTEDGGKTWKKILYVDDKTGVIDLRLDPFDPETLLVAMWERKRDGFDGQYGPNTEWYSPDQYGPEVTYGPGGGLFKSSDGGKTWKKLTGEKARTGLPTVNTGRIGLDYSRKTKGLVYAIIDTQNVGKGRPPLTVYMGITSETEKGGGVRIEAVADDSPAGKAGLKDGDVIVALDSEKIADYDAMIEFLSRKKPDDVVKFTVKRGTEEQIFEVKLGVRRQPPAGKSVMTLLPGFVPDLSDLSGPVKVRSVPKGGAAEKAGVRPGMQVVAVEGKAVGNWTEFRTELRTSPKEADARQAGDRVRLTFVDPGREPSQDPKAGRLEVTLALENLEVALPATGRGTPNPTRPFLLSNTVGGQQPNVQKDQGKNGFNTGGVFKSTDGGETWTRVNSLNPRPFYFSQVRCDPNDDRVVYVLGDLQLWRSTDGGVRFTALPTRGVHPDHHALWINPKDSRHMILGNDGGFYVTYDRGQTWDHLNVAAIGQFYHVCVDNRKPYNVYGGLQDNGSWGGPSQTLRGIGPVNEDWFFLRGGDGFVCRVDPLDPDIVYSESQGGAMGWRNLRTGESRSISARPVKAGEPLRWDWNTPFILSHHNPLVFYCGAQYVFKSLNRGEDLRPISPDLTASKRGTIVSLAESPKNPSVLWAGTSDGNLWVTRDGGQKWENLLEKLKAAGLPGPRWVASIEPGRTVEGRCYVCLDAHRSDDDRPYLFVTEDFGQTWRSITANLPAFGSTRVLREDLTNPELLYCGTEFGIWASLNRGTSWVRLNSNLPTVAVHEVAQPTTASEIVVATHGRSVWVLNVHTLRQMTARKEPAGKSEKTTDPLAEPVTLFAPMPATRWKLEGGREFPYSKEARKFYGQNPPAGTSFDYLLTRPAKTASLKVTDALGTVVREFRTVPTEVGLHRLPWNLSGPRGVVRAGAYRVTLTVDGQDYTQLLTVENDPKADPKAIIGVDRSILGEEEEGNDDDDVGGDDGPELVPLIPLAKD